MLQSGAEKGRQTKGVKTSLQTSENQHCAYYCSRLTKADGGKDENKLRMNIVGHVSCMGSVCTCPRVSSEDTPACIATWAAHAWRWKTWRVFTTEAWHACQPLFEACAIQSCQHLIGNTCVRYPNCRSYRDNRGVTNANEFVTYVLCLVHKPMTVT